MKKVIRFMSVITLSATMLLCSNATSAKATEDVVMMDMNNTHTVTLNLDESRLPNDGISFIQVSTNAAYYEEEVGMTFWSRIYSEDNPERNCMSTNNLFCEGASIYVSSTEAPNVGYGRVGYSPVITKLTVNGVDFTKYIPATFLGEQKCVLICPDFDITIDIEYEMVYYYYDIRETFDHNSDSYKMLVNGNSRDVLGQVVDLSKELPVPSQDTIEQQPEDTTTDIIEQPEIETPEQDTIEQQPEDTTTDTIEQQPEDTTTDIIEQPEIETPAQDTIEQQPEDTTTNTSDNTNVLPIIAILIVSIISIKKNRE